jgi:type IV pilus assembly protein PilE
MVCSEFHRPARERGFTLLELLVVAIIAGILASIAIPSYVNSIRQGRRPEAKTALLDLAAREERFYTMNNYYTASAASLGYSTPFPVALGAGPDYYLSVTSPTGTTQGTAYALEAQANGDQVNDACGNYFLNNLGAQTNSTSTPPSACW